MSVKKIGIQLICLVLLSLCGTASAWKTKPYRWKRWYYQGLADVANLSHIVNSKSSGQKFQGREIVYDSPRGADVADKALEFDFPVLIQNVPLRADRRIHTERMLKTLGFTNIILPSVTPAEDINIEDLLQKDLVRGKLHKMLSSENERRPGSVFAVVALDHCRLVRFMANNTVGMFGLFEDDLLVSEEPSVLSKRIHRVLKDLPIDADMLFLEFCGELCAEIMYSTHASSLAFAFQPKCHGALIFTNKGARKAAGMCDIPWDVNDLMYAELIRAGKLDAYVATPPIFYQDGAWGSNAGREGASLSDLTAIRAKVETRAVHTPCSDEDGHNFFKTVGLGWVVEVTQLRKKNASSMIGWPPALFQAKVSARAIERMGVPAQTAELTVYSKGKWDQMQQCIVLGPHCAEGHAVQVGTMLVGSDHVNLVFDRASLCYIPLVRLQEREQRYQRWTENEGSEEEFFCSLEISMTDEYGDELALIGQNFAMVLR